MREDLSILSESGGIVAGDCWLILIEFCSLKRVYKRRLLERKAVLIEVKSWERALIRSGALKSKAQPLPEDRTGGPGHGESCDHKHAGTSRRREVTESSSTSRYAEG